MMRHSGVAELTVSTIDLLACVLRASLFSDDDPIGAGACCKLLIKPTLEALDGNLPPLLALAWPKTEAGRAAVAIIVRQHCVECGLCPMAKAAALMLPPRAA